MFKRSLLLGVALSFSSLAMAQEWIIDVRTPEEVAAGKVSGAVNVEYQDIVAGVQKLGIKKDDTVYLYCRSGRRSGLALVSLQSAGYGQVENLGGFQQAQDWQEKRSTAATAACDKPQTGAAASTGC